MISIVIPARNAAATIGASLATLAPDRDLIGEILLVDDGSEDGTAELAGDAACTHGLPLRVVSVHAGSAGGARNAGMSLARGDYIFFFDADDEVVAGGIRRLRDALRANPAAGLAVGASLHRGQRDDKLKLPGRYGADLAENARSYLRNEVRSITVGSALVAAAAVEGLRFPETIALDEDTLFWAAVLTRTAVVTVDEPVLVYNLDEARMAERFVSAPRQAFLAASLAIGGLAAYGIGKPTLQARKAFIAQRIARHLLKRNRFVEAADMMRAARCLPGARSRIQSLEYQARIGAGRFAQSLGFWMPAGRRSAPSLRSARRRTLILTVDPAVPPVSGADLRNCQNARAAATIGEARVVSLQPAGGAPADHAIAVAGLAFRGEPRGKALARLRTSVEARIPRIALERLLKLVHRFRPDTIVVEGMPLFALLDHLRPLAPQIILDMHNVESALAAAMAGSRSPQFLPPAWRDADRIRRREKKALRTADRVWVCSHPDERRVRALGPAIPIDVVPNGIPRVAGVPADLRPPAGREGGWPVLLFVGHLAYPPNVVAARRLAEGILPIVRRSHPSARLILAGRNPDSAVRGLGALSGVELIENPDDLAPLFRRGHVCVIPLREGGGTRIKILEAMVWGLPVIATALAAEGQDFEQGEEILIAETDEELARCVTSLMSDSDRVERQRLRAREKAIRLYGDSAIDDAVRKGLGAAKPEAGL